MNSLKIIAFFFFLSIASLVSGQAIDNASSYKNLESDHYFRFSYENDYFTATDDYYTQGINLELVSPSLSKLPASSLLIKPYHGDVKYGMSIEHNGYTPTSISHNEILYNDRPFCAALFLKFFSIAVDSSKHRRLSSSLSLGVVGTAASGKWMQITIHRNLNNIEPHGWDHQVHNDVVLNYELQDERQLFAMNGLQLSSYATIRGGTLSDKASAGATLMIGRFSSPFQSHGFTKKKIGFYFYDQPYISAMGYDATLQGGLFNRSSPYTIAAGDLQRITFQNNFGLVARVGKVNLSYYQSFVTKEFNTGLSHRWGGVSIGVDL